MTESIKKTLKFWNAMKIVFPNIRIDISAIKYEILRVFCDDFYICYSDRNNNFNYDLELANDDYLLSESYNYLTNILIHQLKDKNTTMNKIYYNLTLSEVIEDFNEGLNWRNPYIPRNIGRELNDSIDKNDCNKKCVFKYISYSSGSGCDFEYHFEWEIELENNFSSQIDSKYISINENKMSIIKSY